MRPAYNAAYWVSVDYLCFNGDIMITEKMHELYGKINDHKRDIRYLEQNISEIEKEDSTVSASCTIEINHKKRSSFTKWLSKGQVLAALKEELSDSMLELSKLEKEYADLQ